MNYKEKSVIAAVITIVLTITIFSAQSHAIRIADYIIDSVRHYSGSSMTPNCEITNVQRIRGGISIIDDWNVRVSMILRFQDVCYDFDQPSYSDTIIGIHNAHLIRIYDPFDEWYLISGPVQVSGTQTITYLDDSTSRDLTDGVHHVEFVANHNHLEVSFQTPEGPGRNSDGAIYGFTLNTIAGPGVPRALMSKN